MKHDTTLRNKRQWILLLCIILTGGIYAQTLNFDMDDAVVYNSGEYISQSVTSGADTYTIEVRHATYTDRALLTDLGGGNQVFYFQAGGDTNPWVITFTKNGTPTEFTLNSMRYYAYNDDEISLVNQDNNIIAAATAYGSGTDGTVTITNTANTTNISSFKILPETTVTLNNYGFDNINVSFPATNTAPVIGGTTASQSVNDNSTISPFSTITTTDADGYNLSATITLDDNAKGLLTGTGLSGSGPYTIASTTPADLQTKLRALSYNPTDNRTSTSETTTFTVVINDGADTDTDNTTTVISNAVAPVVMDVNVPSNATYTAGQNLDFTINFNESINVATTGGIPQIAITIGSTIRHATYIAGSGTSSIIFRYTIQSGDIDTDGVAIGALTASGGTLRDSGGKDANLTLNNIGITTAVLVDAIPPPCSAATRLYVDSNATTGSNDGTSWTNAFTNLQDALNCIDEGEEIWVASGTYHPNSAPGTTLTNPTEFYFWMNKNIKLKGSYNPSTNTQDFTNPSILSGDLGTTNTVHVLVTTNLNNTALVEGFTITKGAAIYHTGTITIGGQVIYYNRGGGIYNASSSPIFKNITISENKAQYGGGGMYNDSSSPAIVNLLSINNTVRGRYGGYSDSNAYGGGMLNLASSPTITNATFAYNTVRGGDGEMVVPGVGNDGGSGHGGGIYNEANSLATITNTVFMYNSAAGGGSQFGSAGAGYGAGIFNESSPSSLVNVTFNNNSATTNGGGMHSNASNTTLYNTVFYGNGTDISSSGGSTFMGADNFSENYTGTGFTQLTANPFLASALPKGKDGIWATPDDGLRLIATSPAIDAGNNANLPTDSFDLDGDGNTTESIPYDIAGEDRVQNTTVNIGAYEGVVSCPYPTATTLYVNASVSGGTNDGSSWANAYNNLQDAIWQTYICSNITEIWVAKGTYKPLNETTAIEIPEGVSLYGGFAGTETALSDRDWTANQTILSGDLNSNSNTDDQDAHGILTVKSENIVIDGFIFEHGFADDGSSLEGRTGAALLTHTSAKDIAIKNCVFRNNEAGGTGFNGVGGAVITYGTNVSFTNCLFYANKAKYGGAVSIEGGSLKLINCSFTQNEATDNGGALNTNGKDVTIVNSLFTENTCGGTSCNAEINGAITNITYSYVKGKNPSGTGNIDGTTITDPLFVDTANNDFSLLPASFAVNTGDNAAYTNAGGNLDNDLDLAGNPRLHEGRIDMGAYEIESVVLQPDANNILYVDKNVSGGSGDGSSWANAVVELRDAIEWVNFNWDGLAGVLQIWIAEGTYFPTETTARDKSFNLVGNLHVIGGFAPLKGATDLATRNFKDYPTVLSGDIGVAGVATDNSYSVITTRGNVPDLTVDGCTIEKGYSDQSGGGDNSGRQEGGGWYHYGDGSGIQAEIILRNAVVQNNTTVHYSGGGIYSWVGNSASVRWDIKNSIFRNNHAPGNANGRGGAFISLSLSAASTTTNITNSLFYDNSIGSNTTSTRQGGAIEFYNNGGSSVNTLTNTTFYNNNAAYGIGNSVNVDSAQLSIYNSIFWDGGDEIYNENGTLEIFNSLVQGVDNTANNGLDGTDTSISPQFTDAANDDYGLLPASLAVNTGDNTAYTNAGGDLNNDTDIAGNPRLIGDIIDMGAYESEGILVDFTILGGYCIGDVLTFTDNSSSANGAIVGWEWDFGDGNTSTEQNPTHVYTDTINAEIKLKVIDITGEENTITKTFSVQSPKAKFNANPTIGQAIPHTVFFTDNSTLPDTWEWDFGDGSTSTAQNPIHSYTAAGDYTVNLTVKDTMNGCVDKATDLIKIVIPKAQFSADTRSGCGPLTVSFTDESTIDGNDTVGEWLWDFGDGNTSTAQNPIHTYAATGIYDVSLTITTAITEFKSNETKTRYVQALGPNPDFSSDVTIGCAPLTVNFSDETVFYGPPSDWLWDFGDGTTSNLGSPTHTYTQNGEFDVSLTVTDSDGCSKTIIKKAYISTVETVLPTVITKNLTVPLDASGNVTITTTDIDNGSTDNCGIASMSLDKTSFDCSDVGVNTVTLTVTDTSGNSNTGTAMVTIEDVIPPVPDLINLPVVEKECAVTSADIPIPTATDNCGGVITVTHDAALPITTQGTTVITWTYKDANGNTSTQTQSIIIEDTTAPVADLVILPDFTAECEVTSLIPPSATDNCGGMVTVSHDATLPISTQGTTLVTWTYKDANGNTSIQTQNIIIEDTTAPVADLATLPDITAECEVTSLIPPSATDNCGGMVTVSHDATLPISTQGTTLVTWTYEDANGNTSTQTQSIIIEDTTAPVADLVILPDITAECEVTSLTPPSATDNCGGMVTVSHDATLPISTQGTTVVTWTYEDANGNTSTQTQNIIIEDTTAPVADLSTLPDIIAECEVMSLIPPSATDNCSGMAMVTHDVTLPITKQGTTLVTWTYQDASGNKSMQTQNVIIEDTTAPVADQAILPDITAQCEVSWLSLPTATDNCSGPITVTHDANLPISKHGVTVVTWTYKDESGNTTSQTQNVIIADTEAPELISQIDLQPTVYCYEVPEVPQLEFSDNCGDSVNITYSETEAILGEGYQIVRNWIASDSEGNEQIIEQTIKVLPTEITTQDATVCITETTINLYSLIEGESGNGIWESDNTGITLKGAEISPSEIPVGTYSFTYTEQSGMCSNQISVKVEIVNDCIDDSANNPRIKISDVLTPNGDGMNDYFTITGPDIHGERISLMVFNRWGHIVFESDNYQNNWSGSTRTSHVGTKGKVASGTYFYVIKVANSNINPIKGNIYIGTK
ncbi:PKD domain-containing protein [Zhouia amylolytica]|nr:PKD domain-containing protein [Zhouia amylolytica]